MIRCAIGFATLLQETLAPLLYWLSGLGTPVCFYEYTVENRAFTPLRIMHHPNYVTGTAPKERWSLDTFEPEGEAKLKEVVAHIKEMVADSMTVCLFLVP